MSNTYFNLLYGIDELFIYLNCKPSWYDQFMNVFHMHDENYNRDGVTLMTLVLDNTLIDYSDRIYSVRQLSEQLSTGNDISIESTIDVLYNMVDDKNPLKLFLGALNRVTHVYDVDPVIIGDHLSRGQISSKFDLINTVAEFAEKNKYYSEINRNAVLLGGWYGTIVPFLRSFLAVNKVINVDIDNSALEISEAFNSGDEDYDICEADAGAFLLTEQMDDYDLVFNTSCEHMDDSWFFSIPKGTVVALQTNNYYDCSQHVNCVESLASAKKKYPLKKAVTSKLDTDLYTRFTIVGIK